MIYYAIKPKFSAITRYVKSGDFSRVYDLVYQITENHFKSEHAMNFAENNFIGDILEDDEFTLEIIEDIE